VEAALRYAMAGDTVRDQSLAQDLNKYYPRNTQVAAAVAARHRGATGAEPQGSG